MASVSDKKNENVAEENIHFRAINLYASAERCVIKGEETAGQTCSFSQARYVVVFSMGLHTSSSATSGKQHVTAQAAEQLNRSSLIQDKKPPLSSSFS